MVVVTCSTRKGDVLSPHNSERGEIRVAMVTTRVVAAKAGETRDHYGQIKVRCLVYSKSDIVRFSLCNIAFYFCPLFSTDGVGCSRGKRVKEISIEVNV